MNKKCTLLVAALMTVGVGVANAQSATVPASKWTAGNYYYLKTANDFYLSLSGSNPDSVVVKEYPTEPTLKAVADSALWQITTAGSTPLGMTYQFTNKATNAVLSFAASPEATTHLAPGINAWGFAEGAAGSPIYAYYGAGDAEQQVLALLTSSSSAADSLGFVDNKNAGEAFMVVQPNDALPLNAQSLGNGISVFQLMFGSNYGGNVFAGKQILAKDVASTEYVTLQVQGDETFANGTPKYFGVDTTKTAISGATSVFGANFKVDSTYASGPLHTLGNAKFQHFKFTVNLMNDELAMYVEEAPTVADQTLAAVGEVRVVYASVGATQVLTVSNLDTDDVTPLQGAAPTITAKPGTPSALATGTGVYFLKSASKLAEGGKYWVSKDGTVPMLTADSLSLYHAKGQWYVKETNGKYSIGSRYDGSMLATTQEIYAVQGMANTFVVNNDSVTFEYQKDVNFADKFLGVRHFTVQDIANNGYELSAVSDLGIGNLPVFAADSMLRAKVNVANPPIAFRVAMVMDSIPNVSVNTGATLLGDNLYTATYKLAQQYVNDSVAYNSETGNAGLVLSATQSPLVFTFVTALEGGKYQMVTGPADALEYVSLDVNNANLILSDKVAYFDITAVDAPEYGVFQSAYKEISTNGKFLAMNPLNFFAEVKNEGQPVLKADYNTDNFQMWVEKADTVLPDKNLYYISTALMNPADKSVNPDRFYLVSLSDSTDLDFAYNGVQYSRAGFISRDTIKSMQDSPALFAFKSMAGGEYLLENQRDLNAGKPQYVGIINNVVVMTEDGVGFAVEATSGPTSNEELSASEVVVLGGTGSIVVKNASGKKVTLSNILGKTIGSVVVTSDSFTVPAERGIVVVAIEGESAQKVLVK